VSHWCVPFVPPPPRSHLSRVAQAASGRVHRGGNATHMRCGEVRCAATRDYSCGISASRIATRMPSPPDPSARAVVQVAGVLASRRRPPHWSGCLQLSSLVAVPVLPAKRQKQSQQSTADSRQQQGKLLLCVCVHRAFARCEVEEERGGPLYNKMTLHSFFIIELLIIRTSNQPYLKIKRRAQQRRKAQRRKYA